MTDSSAAYEVTCVAIQEIHPTIQGIKKKSNCQNELCTVKMRGNTITLSAIPGQILNSTDKI